MDLPKSSRGYRVGSSILKIDSGRSSSRVVSLHSLDKKLFEYKEMLDGVTCAEFVIPIK